MRTPADIMSVALTQIESMAQAHIHTASPDTVHRIAKCAREALQQAGSTETARRMEEGLADARRICKDVTSGRLTSARSKVTDWVT